MLLLDSAPDVVDDLGAELEDVERVEYRDGVGELVVDGVLIAVERVRRRHLDPSAKRNTTLLEPVGVGIPEPARDQITGPGSGASGLVTTQSTIPVSAFGPRRRSSTWCQMC